MKSVLQKLDIKLVVADLDDTLLCTYEMFARYINQLCEWITELCNIDPSEFTANLRVVTLEAKELYHVAPEPSWRHVFTRLGDIYPAITVPVQKEGFELMANIYRTPLELKEGAIELLQQLAATGIPLSLVTHADRHWTEFKLHTSGLDCYFNSKNTCVVPTNIAKSTEHWSVPMQAYGIAPQNTLGIGDNFPRDIKPLIELDALAVHVADPNNWFTYSSEENEYAGKYLRIGHLLDLRDTLEQYYSLIDASMRLNGNLS